MYSGTGTSYGADGNIYGGAMSSSSGSATTGRPPQIGRNSIYGPGFNNVDLRVARNIPIHEKIYMQFSADAFNLLNHTIITGVNGTLLAVHGTHRTDRNSSHSCLQLGELHSPSGGPQLQGCISPYTGTGLQKFGVASGTNNGLYGPRQMQFSAKLFF